MYLGSTKKLAMNVVGWYGVAAVFGAYVLVSYGTLNPHHLTYQILNLTGALGLMTEALYKRDVQPAILNMLWAGVAIIALIAFIRA